VRHSEAPNSAGQYSSQPSSPTYVTRSARTGTSPTAMSRQLMYGNASFPRSAVVHSASSARAFGPQSAKQADCDVTSAIRTSADPAAGRWERIQPRSWLPNAVPVTIPKRSSSSRVTVKSHSIPPRRLSICV
jgi:hypothetical protein